MDQAPTAGCLGLKMVRYDGGLESLNLCRLLRARDSLRRRWLGRGRSLGGWGCRRLPQNSLKSAYVRVTRSDGRIRRRLASPNRAKMRTGLRASRCSDRLQTSQSGSSRPTAIYFMHYNFAESASRYDLPPPWHQEYPIMFIP